MAKHDEVPRQWRLVDAEGQILGRLAVRIARLLRGKHKPVFTPHVDCGDGVVVINAEKIRVTGNKLKTKLYQRYSGYPGGLKKEPLEHLLSRRPAEVVRHAVAGMLPKNSLGRRLEKRLRVYAGANHPHAAQLQPRTDPKTPSGIGGILATGGAGGEASAAAPAGRRPRTDGGECPPATGPVARGAREISRNPRMGNGMPSTQTGDTNKFVSPGGAG